MTTAVLVHGAWFGPWMWDDVVRGLADAGVPARAVALASTGPRLGSVADDIDAVTAAVDEVGGPVVLVGHSFGGLPATAVAAGHLDVVGVVYVSAFTIPAGLSLMQALGGAPPDWWEMSADERSITPRDAAARFLSSCPEPVATDAARRLRPLSARSVHDPLGAADYGRVPTTYVVCGEDAAFPPEGQRAGAQAIGARPVEIATDHCPMLSRPAELTAVLVDAAVS